MAHTSRAQDGRAVIQELRGETKQNKSKGKTTVWPNETQKIYSWAEQGEWSTRETSARGLCTPRPQSKFLGAAGRDSATAGGMQGTGKELMSRGPVTLVLD